MSDYRRQQYLNTLTNRQNNVKRKNYEYQGDLNQLGDLAQLGQSEEGNIQNDRHLDEASLQALAQMRERSARGLTDRDRADMAASERDVNRQSQGRLGAIKQEMAAKGLAGSNMDYLAQMQEAQAGTELANQRSMDIAGRSVDARDRANADMGAFASNLQNEKFAREQAKARARDRINEFNTTNSINRQMQNNQIANQSITNRQNFNTNAANQFNQMEQDSYDRDIGAARTGFDAETAAINEERARKEAERKRRAGMGGAVLGTAGAVVGGIYGGPAGAAVGSSVGSAAGGAIFSDRRLKEDVRETNPHEIDAFLESIKPSNYKYKGQSEDRTGIVAQDLEKSSIGSKLVKNTPAGKVVDVDSAVSALLNAVAHLNRKVDSSSKK